MSVTYDVKSCQRYRYVECRMQVTVHRVMVRSRQPHCFDAPCMVGFVMQAHLIEPQFAYTIAEVTAIQSGASAAAASAAGSAAAAAASGGASAGMICLIIPGTLHVAAGFLLCDPAQLLLCWRRNSNHIMHLVAQAACMSFCTTVQ